MHERRLERGSYRQNPVRIGLGLGSVGLGLK